MKKIVVKTIGIAFNLKKKGVVSDRYEEYDDKQTITGLKKEIEKYGVKVVLLEQNNYFFRKVKSLRPDFILNIAEGIGNTRGRESQVPCILESLGIPYSGSDPVVLGITLDKYFTNNLLKSVNVPVPLMFCAKNTEELNDFKNIFRGGGRFIVKPRWEGSSKGIFLDSVVSNFKNLKKRSEIIFSRYNQPALIEEFLEKEEITVGVCGNAQPYILGMMKIVPRDKAQKIFLYSLETKRDWKRKVSYESCVSIPECIQVNLKNYALKAFKALDLRDVARIDFRIGRDNMPKIIDINPLPGLSPHYSDLPILYKLGGGSYCGLVKTILKEALLRCGFRLKINYDKG